MFSLRFPRRKKTEAVPRRRRIADDEFSAGAAPSASPSSQFRRNQTLSSYRHNTPEESSRQKAHHLARQRRRLGGIFLVVTLIVAGLLFLLWQLIAQVTITTTSRQLATSFSTKPYEQVINDYLAKNPAQRLRLALDQTALTQYVSDQLPEVEDVKVTGLAGIARASVAITFRTPVAGWQINSKQYYVDADGVVFDKNYYSAPAVQIIDESGVSPEQGSTVVGTRLLGFLGKVVSQAKGRGYTVVKALLPADTTRQVDVYFDGIATRVKMSIDRGAGEQLEDAQRSLNFLKSTNVTPEYIDVRVPGRAAYR